MFFELILKMTVPTYTIKEKRAEEEEKIYSYGVKCRENTINVLCLTQEKCGIKKPGLDKG
jgi:hypothetical protein